LGIRETKLQLRGTGSWSFQDWVPKLELGNQHNYDLWHARQTVNLDAVEKIEFRAAYRIKDNFMATGSYLGRRLYCKG